MTAARNTDVAVLENALHVLMPIAQVARAVSPGQDTTMWIMIPGHHVMRYSDLLGAQRAYTKLLGEIRRRHDGKKVTSLAFLKTLRSNIQAAVCSWDGLRTRLNRVHVYIGVHQEKPYWLEYEHLTGLLDFDLFLKAEIIRRQQAVEALKRKAA